MSTSIDPERVLSFLVRHTWLGMRAAIEDELVGFGLTVPQFATLMMLSEMPDQSPAQIARKCGSTRQAANEMIGGLEAAGLLVRSPHPTDRRTHQLRLTELGVERFAQAAPAVRKREEVLEAGLSEEQKRAAREWMGAVALNCSELSGPSGSEI